MKTNLLKNSVNILILWILISPLLSLRCAKEEKQIYFSNMYGDMDTISTILREGMVLKNAGEKGADIVEAAIVNERWHRPEAGEQIHLNAERIEKWEEVHADSTGWFRDREVRGGYYYFSFNSKKDRVLLLESIGNNMALINGVPHIGNRYRTQEKRNPWQPPFDFSIIPIELNKGENDLLFKCYRGGLKVKLYSPEGGIIFNEKDLTVPDLRVGEKLDTYGSIVLINTTDKPVTNCKLISYGEDKTGSAVSVPVIPPVSIRKVPFRINCKIPEKQGEYYFNLQLIEKSGRKNILLDTVTVKLKIVGPKEPYRRTFVSNIDGSVQYYAVNPALNGKTNEHLALFFSLHGADVKAINQAGSYYNKSWGTIVCPTNRRPYGYDWEDWGRIDALEVYDIAKKELRIDPNRIYLTGHSMGGHGTWYLGATYPDKFAAIGPSAGWISFWSYVFRESHSEMSPLRKMFIRAFRTSDTFALAENLKNTGIYIIHGADDNNVSPKESYQMIERLQQFHKDYVFHEQQGAGHWWDKSDEPGTDCVDWAPLFDFFARHANAGKKRVREISFITANPGVSASNEWITIWSQEKQLELSRVDIRFDPGLDRFVGKTENVAKLCLNIEELGVGDSLRIFIDKNQFNIESPASNEVWLENKFDGNWQISSKPSLSQKGPHRYGTFKDAFKNRVIFVYGTNGTEAENKWALQKARYDAETFWYQGNGSIDIIPDMEFDNFAELDRNVILYGNAETNLAWEKLLGDSPVEVRNNYIKIEDKEIKGDLACFFIRPKLNSNIASVGVVSGTNLTGMKLTNNRPYLYPGNGFPDLVVFDSEILTRYDTGIKAVGFFGIDWSVKNGEFLYE